jgi:GNAT superfamily N-acetyltransferase
MGDYHRDLVLDNVAMTVNIRSARPRDAAAVVAMAIELSRGEDKPPRDFDEDAFRRDGFGLRAAFSCLIAEVEGAPAGYALFHKAYDAESGQRGSFLHDLYLRPAHRGRGLGRALLTAVCRATQKSGGQFVWWCMVDDNRQADGFYRHLAQPLHGLKVWIAEGERFLKLSQAGEGSH